MKCASRSSEPIPVKYSLDTNVCIHCIQTPSEKVARHLRTIAANDVVVCSVVRAELAYGASKSVRPQVAAAHEAFLTPYPCADFDAAAAQVFGRLHADLERRGKPIGPYDLQVAAIAIANGLTLITHNVREFSRVDGLKWADWEA